MSPNSSISADNKINQHIEQARETARQEEQREARSDEVQGQQDRRAQDTAGQALTDEDPTIQSSQKMDAPDVKAVGETQPSADNLQPLELDGEQLGQEAVDSAHQQQDRGEDWQAFSLDAPERNMPPTVEDLSSNPNNDENKLNAGELLKQMAIDNKHIKA
jgi:hypothetical protein